MFVSPSHYFCNNLEVARGKIKQNTTHTRTHFNEMHTGYLTPTPTFLPISSSYQFTALTERTWQPSRGKVNSLQILPERLLELLDRFIITFDSSSGGELYICQVVW